MPQVGPYTKDIQVARVGMIADQRPRKVYSRVSKTNVPYGYYLCQDTTIPVAGSGNPSTDGAKFPAQASDITGNIGLGVAAETLAIESAPRTSFINAVQMLMSQNVPVSGVLTLGFNGQVSANINWNDNAATIQTKLAAMANVGAGNVSVSGAFNAGPVLVTFQGALAGNPLSLMTVVTNTMVDATPNPVVVKVNEQVPYADLPIYPANHEINVLGTGAIFVIVEEDVDPTSPVFVRFAADPALPQYGPGSFRASADVVAASPTAAQLSNARYMNSAVAGGLALLEILTFG